MSTRPFPGLRHGARHGTRWAHSRLVVAATLAWIAPAVAAAPPDGVRERVVMADGVIDGRALSVSGLSAALDADAALTRYRQAWNREGATIIGPIEQGAWRILSRRLPAGLETVQWRAARGGGAEGFRTVWPDVAPAATGSTVPLPAMPDGFTRQRLLSARDAGRRSVTLLAIGDVPLEGARQRWVRSLERDGWSAAAMPGREAGGVKASSPLWFRKGDAVAALDVSTSAGRSTALLVMEWER